MGNFNEKMQAYFDMIENALPDCIPDKTLPQGEVARAMEYSLMGGGKRLRGILVLSFCELCGGDPKKALPFACAIEMIHAYSLIHDDLPCMDDDDMRRGKPSCHKAFSEAVAVLAGDALLTHAFSVAQRPYFANTLPASTVIRVVSELAGAAGTEGMVGGQVIDITSSSESLDEEKLSSLQALKTGALIRAAARIGCIAAGAGEDIVLRADRYAAKIGLAFQIVDDILDATSTTQELGKPVGSDADNGKTTYITLLGLEKSREKVKLLVFDADLAIKGSCLDEGGFLYELADMLAVRKK